MAPVRWMDWESHLVARAQVGETVAFELLCDLHRDALYAQAMRMLRNPEDAKDAVQDTFVKAFRALAKFRPGKPPLPWLARICSNCCVDIIRLRKQSAESIDLFEYALSADDDVQRDMETCIQDERVRASVEKLPRHYREIVMMRHFRHMEVSEIAIAVNRPEGTVKSWLFRARHLMRKDLEPVLAAS